MADVNVKIANHTPAPWQATRDPSHFYSLTDVIDAADSIIAQVVGGHPVIEMEANCRLIAAAPEMLAALKAMTSADSSFSEAFNMAREAIAKAEAR